MFFQQTRNNHRKRFFHAGIPCRRSTVYCAHDCRRLFQHTYTKHLSWSNKFLGSCSQFIPPSANDLANNVNLSSRSLKLYWQFYIPLTRSRYVFNTDGNGPLEDSSRLDGLEWMTMGSQDDDETVWWLVMKNMWWLVFPELELEQLRSIVYAEFFFLVWAVGFNVSLFFSLGCHFCVYAYPVIPVSVFIYVSTTRGPCDQIVVSHYESLVTSDTSESRQCRHGSGQAHICTTSFPTFLSDKAIQRF